MIKNNAKTRDTPTLQTFFFRLSAAFCDMLDVKAKHNYVKQGNKCRKYNCDGIKKLTMPLWLALKKPELSSGV
jgi:hypothetical protein